jgi:hypothetical protein
LALKGISDNLLGTFKYGLATVVPYYMGVKVVVIIMENVNDQEKVNLLNRTSHKNKGSEKCASVIKPGVGFNAQWLAY